MIPIGLGISLYNYALIVLLMVRLDIVNHESFWFLSAICTILSIGTSAVLWATIESIVKYFREEK